jgi:hypothetical protein
MDVLRVRSDRARIDRVFGTTVALMLLPAVMGVVAAVYFLTHGAGYAVGLFAVVVVGTLPLALVQYLVWMSIRRIEHPLEVGPYGMTFETPRGSVSFPWEAVTAIGITPGGRIPLLAVQLHRQVGPGAPGVAGTLTPSGWRAVRRQGLRLSLRSVQTGPAELADAIRHFSSGRWAPALTR